MKALMDELFEAMIQKLIEENYITFENYFLDGTRLKPMPISTLSYGKNPLQNLKRN
ncbi:hypothetical protein ACJROX_13400 [Pseudalkalibacillus sp. A8]|uniref:hypothetical protein n=1 Tax=Pseudalkalibacillus sp. A8 TaxID=3382641 RepID=UPI0038B5779A